MICSEYCTVYVYILPFIDPDIVLSMFICCHSLILILYCLCLYVAIHWSWYCTVYVYMLPFTDPDIVLSMFICCHSLILILYCLCLYVAIHWPWYCTIYVYAGFNVTAGQWPVYLWSGQSNRTKIGPLGQLISSGHLGQQLSFLPTGRFFVHPCHSISR
jgi:hypothetical protein